MYWNIESPVASSVVVGGISSLDLLSDAWSVSLLKFWCPLNFAAAFIFVAW